MKIYGDYRSEDENTQYFTVLDSLPVRLYNEIKTEKGEWVWLGKKGL